MWEVGNQKPIIIPKCNDELELLTDDMSEKDAKISLAKFLYYNLGVAAELIMDVKLLPIQEIFLNAMFRKDYGLIVAGRGIGKSFLLSVFCPLYAIFHPNKKIVIVSSNFRASRRIMQQIEKFVNGKNAPFLRQCFKGNLSKLPDCYSWELYNGSEIRALPLSGDGIRGERAAVLIIDEALLISQQIQESVLQPFLTSRQDMREQLEVNEIEDELIAKGLMAEEDRTILSKNKMIMMSSASFEFEYLYKGIYVPNIEHIRNPEKGANYSSFVIRASYEAMPENTVMDSAAVEKAKKDFSTVNFDREYRAVFVNASGSYFNIKKLHECTVQDNDEPTTRLCGFKDEEFILAIDPSYSASKTSDYFSMGVYLIDKENRRIIQVHSYGKAGANLKDHYGYLTYILKNFNIVWVSIDASGTEFLDGYNESLLAKENGINLQYLEIDFEKGDYLENLRLLKNRHNLQSKKIVYPQIFSSGSIRAMNQYLQNGIDAYKVWFASRICCNDKWFKKYCHQKMPVLISDGKDDEMGMVQWMEDQDNWIYQTKMQLALIEVKATALGTLQFDLPKSAKNSDSPDRPRRDNYTCLLMGYMASKYYFDMLFTPIEKNSGFIPFFI